MKRAASRPRVAILGCGPVGKALAVELLDSERAAPLRSELRVWSRSGRSRAALRRLLVRQDRKNARRLRLFPSAGEAFADADLVLLCVADDAIQSVARELAESRQAFHGQVVLFTNGYLPLACLAPLRRRGCAIGRLHPLAPIPSGQEFITLTMAPFAIEGDARAVQVAKRLVRGIEGDPLFLTKRRGAAQAYHAGASLLCGGLTALFYLAEQVMSESVSSPAALRDALADFADITLWNARVLGPEKALTGALSRGSETLVRGHLAALKSVPAALELYRLLGGTMLELGHARGSIDFSESLRLRALLYHKRLKRLRPGDWRKLVSPTTAWRLSSLTSTPTSTRSVRVRSGSSRSRT